MIERLGRERPVVLWLDDAQWGSDALGLAQDILDADGAECPLPVLILLTIQQEALAERPLETHLVERLLESPRASVQAIEPLGPADRKELVRVLLRLQGDLVDRVADRTAGNPLFAVQLVGDWVQRGVLEVGRDGFVLSAGRPLDLPDDLHAVWAARVDRVLEQLAPGSRETLEVASALGLRVDRWEWHVAAVESAAVRQALQAAPQGTALADVSQVLLRRLVALNLVTPGAADAAMAFVHGMLRESIERGAREAGRWQAHNAACAAMLRKCYPLGGRGIAERLGRHLVAAGCWEEAVAPLLEGAEARREASEFGAAQDLLALREDAMAQALVAPDDERWGAGWVLRCRVHEDQNQLDEALRWAGTAEERARDHGWEPTLAAALAVTGTITSRRGQQDIATDSFERARALYELHEDPRGVAECLRGLGTAAALAGDFDRADALLRKALASFERLQMLFEVAHCMRALGNLAWTAGKPARAGAWWDQTLAMCDSVGDRLGTGLCLNGLAEVARVDDKLDVALHLYKQAIAILKSVDSGWTYYRSTLAMIQLARGEFDEAQALLEEIAAITRQQGQLGYLGCAHAALLACCGGVGDWRGWDRNYEAARLLLQQTSMIEPDVAWAAQQAGDLAASAGQGERARQAYRLASLQYMALNKGKEVRRIAGKLSALRGAAAGPAPHSSAPAPPGSVTVTEDGDDAGGGT
jgi:tetratricopeptide (TPR) repeat protein